MKKFIFYAVMLITCVAGVFCGLYTYKGITESGQVVGEMVHYKPYEDFDKFNYDLTGQSLYESTDKPGTYEIRQEVLVPNEDTDFTDLNFDVIINNKPCYNVYVYERIIFAETELNFVNLYGHDVGTIKLNLEFQYWVNKTVVIVYAPDCYNIARLNTYLDIYGLEIRIIPAQHESYKVDNSADLVKVNYFDGCDNAYNLTTVNVYENKTVREVYNELPTNINRPGFNFKGWGVGYNTKTLISSAELDKTFNENDGGSSYTFYPIFEGVDGYGIYNDNGTLVVNLEDLVNNGNLYYAGNYCLKTLSNGQPTYTGKLVLPGGIKELEIYPSNLNITSLEIPNTVTDLIITGSCSNLAELNLPGSVTTIVTLEGCSALNNVFIPGTVTTILANAFNNLDVNILCEVITCPAGYYFTNSDKAYFGFTRERYSEAIKNLDAYTVYGLFDSLYTNKLLVPWQNLLDNGYFIYDNDNAIKVADGYQLLINGYLKTNLTCLAPYAFSECSNLTGIEFATNLSILPNYAFKNCKNLKEVEAPGLKKIASFTFFGCSKLNVIDISEIDYIGASAFAESGLTNIVIPSGITKIYNNTFYNCSKLKSVTLPNSLQTIDEYVFSGCYGIASINLPNSITTLGNSAFEGCSGLTSVTLPNSLTTLSEGLFARCYFLTTVTIPSGVTTISGKAFSVCESLTTIYIPATVITINATAFEYTNTAIYCEVSTAPSGYNLNGNSAVYGYSYARYLEVTGGNND